MPLFRSRGNLTPRAKTLRICDHVAQEMQQASLNGLMQRYHMVEQQRQMQRQHAMQMGQTTDPADASLMQNNQHVSASEAFLQQQRMPPGQIGTHMLWLSACNLKVSVARVLTCMVRCP